MLTTPLAPSFPPELQRAWGEEGEGEYHQLLRVTKAAQNGFFLFLLESDYSPAIRDIMLDCLRADLAAGGLRLRRVTLTADCTDLFRLPELETPATPDEVIVLVGIENTPGLVSEPGRRPERPPIFALLNRLRETLHSRFPAPFLVWCTPSVYTGLQTHAPDFFDHYASLFQFLDAAPAALPDRLPTTMSMDTSPLPTLLSTAAMRSAVAFYEEQIARHQEPTPERAHAQLGLANALAELHGPDYLQHVLRALHVVEDALSLLSPERDAYEWARGQIIKGVVYNRLLRGDRAENLQHAIECYQAALQVFTETDFPYEWARTQNNLGNVYTDLPTADRKRHPMRAIEYYYAALRVRTKTDFPYEWARTQNNLGNAYYLLPASSRAENLQHAIECYQAALQVFTETDFPYEWARTQNNLGNVYTDLPTGGEGINLQQAIACFEAALRVYTKADFPQEWAKTQSSLGIVYVYLSTGDRTQNFRRAADCYEAALDIFTERDFPRDWADTQYNLALAQERLENRDAARQALHCAIAGYRQVGLGTKAEQAENTLRMLEYA